MRAPGAQAAGTGVALGPFTTLIQAWLVADRAVPRRLTSITYPGNRTATRAYDDAGRFASVTDWLNNTTTFAYDDNDNLSSTTFPSATGNVDTYGVDNADGMTSTTMKKGAATLASLSYGRDNSDLVTSSTPTGLPQGPETYGYTPLSQLKTVNGATQFGYDAADNPTRMNGVATLGYNAGSQLTSVPHGGAPKTFAYDNQGNRTTATAPSARSYAYTFDQANRMTQASTTNAAGLLAAGSNHTLAARNDGTVWAWGANASGQLGLGDATNRTSPTQVTGVSGITTVAAGGAHSLAAGADGAVWSWGANGSGQLGDGSQTARNVPTRVQNLLSPVSLAGGGSHSLALAANGTVWAWGSNASGQLGDGTQTNRSLPAKVPGLTGVVAIAAGANHSLAVKSDGTVWAWGANASSQLGNGNTTMQKSPVQVSALTGAVSVAAGAAHSLALKADGTAWGWGANASGQIGNGSTKTASTPAQVSSFTTGKWIAAGENHSVAIKADGTVWAWGANASGQIGNGSTRNATRPAQVTGLTSATAVAAGAAHTVAARTDNTLRAWGSDASGQLGNGANPGSTTPVTVTGVSNVGGGTLARYGYDGDGLRASKTVLGTARGFTWDVAGGLPMLLLDGTTAYVYGPGGLPVSQIAASGAVTYLHHDQLGSTRGLTDSSGAVSAAYTYDPFGTLAASTGTATSPLGFAGQYSDAETGFQYLRARYLDPASGQFLTRDALAAQTREPYGYVGNNPLNYTDPSGLCWGPGCWVEEAVMVGQEILRDPGAAASDAAKGAANFGVGFTNAALGTSFEGFCGGGQSWSRNIGSATFFLEATLATGLGGATAETGTGVRGITGYTRHGLNSAISHDGVGVSPAAILDAVRNPIRIVPQAERKVRYVGEKAAVVLNDAGRVVTTWARSRTGWRI